MKRVVLSLVTSQKEEIVDFTAQVQRVVEQEQFKSGLIQVFCPHTTAGISINESADPDVKRDVLYTFARWIPFQDQFKHAEGNSKAHVLSTLVGVSHGLAVEDGKLLLGTWQSLWFCEFDGPRKRQVWVCLT
jgi:secondary thiamine-phosphate synthase enzyme